VVCSVLRKAVKAVVTESIAAVAFCEVLSKPASLSCLLKAFRLDKVAEMSWLLALNVLVS
jgi:hypothetical protein